MSMLKKAYNIFILLLVCVSSVYAQNQMRADSIKNLIETGELNSDEELKAYYRLSVYSVSPVDVITYGNKALELAEASNNLEYILRSKLSIGVGYRFLGDLGKALEYQFESAGEAVGQEELLPILAEIYAEISTSYAKNNDFENALLYGSKMIDIFKALDSNIKAALGLLNVGYFHYLTGNYDSALANYNESEPILEEVGMTAGIAYVTGNRALVYWKNGDVKKAKNDLFKAIEMLEPLGDRFAMADYYNRLGNIFLEEGVNEKAEEYTIRGLDMAMEDGLKEQIRDASKLLFSTYRSKGELEKALTYQTQYYAYRDSIQNVETTQKLANLRTEFELKNKQLQIEKLLEQKRSNQITIIVGGVLIIGMISFLIIRVNANRTRILMY